MARILLNQTKKIVAYECGHCKRIFKNKTEANECCQSVMLSNGLLEEI